MGTSQSSDLEEIRSHCNHEVSSCPRLCGRRRCCRAPALEPVWQQSLLWAVQHRLLLWQPCEALHLWWPGLSYLWLWQEGGGGRARVPILWRLWLQQRSLQALLRPVQRWLQLYEALHLWWPGLPYFWLWQEGG